MLKLYNYKNYDNKLNVIYNTTLKEKHRTIPISHIFIYKYVYVHKKIMKYSKKENNYMKGMKTLRIF